MAGLGPPAVQSHVPGAITSASLLACLILVGTAEGVLADPGHGEGDRGVRTGVNAYHPFARSPGASGATSASAGGGDGRPAGDTGDGCIVRGAMVMCEKCADPAGTGVCDAHQPSITPDVLAHQAWDSLRLPLPDVRTAPPRRSRGLVGLPEWVWVPHAQWRSLSRRASAGGVWAEVTAAPKHLIIYPGAGLPPVRCSGPGVAFDPVKPASVQHTDCSYTYRRSSATQPGGVYRVKVTVVWGGRWVGSGGAGGGLPDISRSTTFGLRVAEAQGLYG